MEEQINICVTCLSTDRHLIPVHKLAAVLHEIHFEELQEPRGGVCWECRSILAKFHGFKNKAKTAQETLLKTTEHNNIKSLTTLSKTNIFVCKTNYCDTELKVDKDSIKEENVDQIDDNLDVIEENSDKIDDNLEKIDGNLDQFYEIPIERPGKYESTYSEVDVVENKYSDNLFGKQENFLQGERYIFNETNEKINQLSINFKSIEKKLNMYLPKRIDSRQNKDGVRVMKKISQKVRDTDDTEFQEKFVQVVLSEQEMVGVREERRNHPSFRKLPHICHGCVLGFRKEEKYKSHMRKKHDEKIGKLICEVCTVRFPHKLALNKHKRKHYVVYRCRLCKYQGNDLRSAVNHCKIKHASDKPDSIHCSQCDFVAKNPQDLEEHVEREHQFWCNECGEKFKLKKNIRIHMTRTHAPKRAFKCDICKKGFKTKMQQESHLARHNDNIAKKLSYCQQCNIQFKNLMTYRMHLKNTANHSEGYTCSECNKIFTAKSYMKQHYDFYHLKKSQYKCEICNKTFKSKSSLKDHQDSHLGKSRPRKYSCNICSKMFFSMAVLRRHQQIHSDERPYMCADCGDTFKQSACLYTHTRLKHRGGGRKRKRDC